MKNFFVTRITKKIKKIPFLLVCDGMRLKSLTTYIFAFFTALGSAYTTNSRILESLNPRILAPFPFRIPHSAIYITTCAFVSILLLLASYNYSNAGDYHIPPLTCWDCHRMHARDTTDAGPGVETLYNSGTGYKYLLRANGTNALCQLCHLDQTGAGDIAPDVIGAVGAGQAAYRQAGALTTGTNPYEDTNGHTLSSTSVAPGGSWSNASGLSCTDCHNPHGIAAQYRNLLLRPGGVGSDLNITYVNGGSNDTAKDVWQSALTDTSTQYARSNIKFNEPITTASAYAAWCQGCHTNLHGSANTGDPEPWIRHPTANVNIASTTKTDYTNWSTLGLPVQVMAQNNDWQSAQTNTPSCMSCHKAHGSTHKFGVIWDEGSGDGNPENGTGILQTCQQCHNK